MSLSESASQIPQGGCRRREHLRRSDSLLLVHDLPPDRNRIGAFTKRQSFGTLCVAEGVADCINDLLKFARAFIGMSPGLPCCNAVVSIPGFLEFGTSDVLESTGPMYEDLAFVSERSPCSLRMDTIHNLSGGGAVMAHGQPINQ